MYLNGEVPENYICGVCGASNCKLWRPYQTFIIELYCAECAAEDQNKCISDLDSDGRRTESHQKIDSIGWLVPAVPTEEGDGYWGYTSVPEKGCQWWRKLPTWRQASTRISFFHCVKKDILQEDS